MCRIIVSSYDRVELALIVLYQPLEPLTEELARLKSDYAFAAVVTLKTSGDVCLRTQ